MKRLIFCCDGTWNSADQERDGVPCPTNVVRIAYRVAKRDGDILQITFYDQGVGTGNLLDRYSGGAFGEGLEDNIHDAYRFLMANYEPGDQLFFFGFSRGAFTVRSIVGMIRKCGILKRSAVDKYRDALALYRSEEGPVDPRPTEFREAYSVCGSRDIEVWFIGVWDTVGALGIPLRGLRWLTRSKHQFYDTELSGIVRHAYHALAIDEHRSSFEPTLWQYNPKEDQKVEQVWFCGAHSDVGGGYSEYGLADITIGWMIEKAQQAGLVFDKEAMDMDKLAPNPLEPIHNSKTGFYRLTIGIDRPIGLQKKQNSDASNDNDPTQSVHDTARMRWDKDAHYRPVALRDYFKSIGDPRGNLP